MILIIGSKGMLGMAVANECLQRGQRFLGLDLTDADFNVDMTNDAAVASVFNEVQPDVVINCAAIVDVERCDSDPLLAWNVNARAVSLLTQLCRKNDSKLVHVSTDHYFSGSGSMKHDERAPVSFFNEYARTKFAGEAFALSVENSLVLRTNIIGFRGHGYPTFAEWAFDAVEQDREITLFGDSFVSCIDTDSFATVIFDLVEGNACGLFNVANHEVFSKKELILKIAACTNLKLNHACSGSVAELNVHRADSCGLDVTKAEKKLGYTLPTLSEVVARLVEKRKRGNG